jgi:hypothetical protein
MTASTFFMDASLLLADRHGRPGRSSYITRLSSADQQDPARIFARGAAGERYNGTRT